MRLAGWVQVSSDERRYISHKKRAKNLTCLVRGLIWLISLTNPTDVGVVMSKSRYFSIYFSIAITCLSVNSSAVI